MKNENKNLSEIKNELRAKLDSDNEREIAGNTSHTVIAGVIAKWEFEGKSLLGSSHGKRNEKKFIADVVAAFADQGGTVTARIDYNSSLCHLHIAGLSNDGELRHFLGYTSDTTYRSVHALSVTGFEENDCSYGRAAVPRIAARKAITDTDLLELATAIHAENKAKAKLDALVAYGAQFEQLSTIAHHLACRDCQ